MSRRVRELLSIHNIGQRLFAKYVLGLSQGTVSELLSKPKSWDKLTEKGRDSYRKMHAWCYDENAVMLLKSLIPRKGELMRPVSQAPPPLPAPHLTMMKGNSIIPPKIPQFLSQNDDLCHSTYSRYTFLSKHNIHKSLCGHCFWAPDPLIDRF